MIEVIAFISFATAIVVWFMSQGLDRRLEGKSSHSLQKPVGDAGYDLRAAKRVVVQPGEWQPVPLGLTAEFPPSAVGMVVARSGQASKRGLIPINAPGILDSSYRGEWVAQMLNLSQEPQTVEEGERICQVVFVNLADISFTNSSSFSTTKRGDGGFGSSGTM